MGRIRRNSPVLARATTRASNLRAISPTLDLGPGLTLAIFEQLIEEFRAAQDEYNTLLSTIDKKKNSLEKIEKALDDLNTRMLSGVGARWGKNSDEYEQAGGTRTDERKKSDKSDTDDDDKKPSDS